MKTTIVASALILILASTDLDRSFAQTAKPASTAGPALSTGPVKTAPPRSRTRRMRVKTAAKPAAKQLDPRKINILLYGTMERLDTFSALYENLGLRLSTDTLKKAYELDKAVNKLTAEYFKIEEPKQERETLKTYRGLLDSALKSVKNLKEMKDRTTPEKSETAIALCKDLYLAMETELADAKLVPVKIEPKAAAAPKPSLPGDDIDIRSALSELTQALELYRIEEGKYPKHLKQLRPKYLPELPFITLAGHTKTNAVTEIDSAQYDKDPAGAVKDTGKWLYFTDKKSDLYGKVLIDCSHKNARGAEFYKIGESQ